MGAREKNEFEQDEHDNENEMKMRYRAVLQDRMDGCNLVVEGRTSQKVFVHSWSLDVVASLDTLEAAS